MGKRRHRVHQPVGSAGHRSGSPGAGQALKLACQVGPGARSRYSVPYGWWGLLPTSGRSAPGGMPAGGLHFSCEKWRKEHQGLCPWTPVFKAARCSLAPSFGIAAQRDGSGFYCDPPTGPDLETFFFEIFSDWIFSQSNVQLKLFLRIGVSKSGLVHFCQKETAALSSSAKEEASPSERFFPGGAGGGPPATLCVRAFS